MARHALSAPVPLGDEPGFYQPDRDLRCCGPTGGGLSTFWGGTNGSVQNQADAKKGEVARASIEMQGRSDREPVTSPTAWKMQGRLRERFGLGPNPEGVPTSSNLLVLAYSSGATVLHNVSEGVDT
jgi:hypothetical protein